MSGKTFFWIRALVAFFMAVVLAVAFNQHNIWLGLGAIGVGIIFLVLVRKKVKDILVDERVINVAGRAGAMTYRILTVVLAVGGMVLIIFGQRDNQEYFNALGLIFTYLAMFSMLIYSLSYWLYNQDYE